MTMITEGSIEGICRIMGDNLSGTEITRLLETANFPANNYMEGDTKWRRLYALFTEYSATYKSQNHIYKVIEDFLNPRKYVSNQKAHKEILDQMNIILAFDGIRILESGKVSTTIAATTLREANINSSSFKMKLSNLNIHPKILSYCTPEILNNDYHSIIFESSKGLYDDIRIRTGLVTDGSRLIDECFKISDPYIAFNTLQTDTERNEHKGFIELLKSITSMFRNPRAHTPKIYSSDSEFDCIQILHLISFAFYKLDKSIVVKTN
ncbi:TIGR02391 family protein [Erysipelothrix sp. HDW6B]|uniref:TIGR02391 family protein n=1 Tax=Erysipelothrix sp. HDW6B TaxID=2714929 RepID=UPI00140A9588|nr:TIGR02391 family protein [Erysipelothrix sp. HDW6B]QIK85841.1 TIGR02391 family protein [Erysipelothrix sp. HDW6B]